MPLLCNEFRLLSSEGYSSIDEVGIDKSYCFEESDAFVVWLFPSRSFMILKLKPFTDGLSKRLEGFKPFSLLPNSLQNSGKCSSIPINCLK